MADILATPGVILGISFLTVQVQVGSQIEPIVGTSSLSIQGPNSSLNASATVHVAAYVPVPDAIEYVYMNVGVDLAQPNGDAVEYEYLNVGVDLPPPTKHTTEYVYINVGVDMPPPDKTSSEYVYMNVEEQLAYDITHMSIKYRVTDLLDLADVEVDEYTPTNSILVWDNSAKRWNPKPLNDIEAEPPIDYHGDLSGLEENDHPQYPASTGQEEDMVPRTDGLGGWRFVSASGMVGGSGDGTGGTSNHGDLFGLSQDDHHQYALADGTRGEFEAKGRVVEHEEDIDPHTQYSQKNHEHTESDISDFGSYPDSTDQLPDLVPTTDGAGGWAFEPAGSATGGTSDHGQLEGLDDDDHPHYALTDGSRGAFEVQGAVSAHESEEDPHPQYVTEAEIGTLSPADHEHGSYPDSEGKIAGKVAETDGQGGWVFIDTPSGETSGSSGASNKGVIVHEGNNSIARPSGYTSVEWIGSVEPLNATQYDTWVDTSQ